MLADLTPEKWTAVSRLLDEALTLPETERQAWLEGLPESCAEWKPLLRDLLSTDPLNDFLGTLPDLREGPAEMEGLDRGATLGRYRLVRELGHGGMGAVWLALRADGTLKRPVALKVPYPGLLSRHFLERFERERDILAALTHPNIATLYDAGVDRGQPYLALEYVEGASLLDYSKQKRQTIRERLGLFLQVLAAVQHAHSHLVVHRDLKPSNILVTPEGQVKLLDFGIAKLLSEAQSDPTNLTQAGARMLTPEYAAPEQINGQAVSTATDVYALGIVLYELLSGEYPWSRDRGSRRKIEQAILETDPALPSRAADAKSGAALRGDLDAIILKALQKAPGQRYATADAFAEDIQRYLAGDVVTARPQSAWYRTRKFLVRYRVAVGATAAVGLALAAGFGMALHEARIARAEAKTALAVEQFLTDIFQANAGHQPDPVKARQTTARQLLDIGAERIDSQLSAVPEARMRMLGTLGNMYTDLGLDEQAADIERKRVAVARQVYGNSASEVAYALTRLANRLHTAQSSGEREASLQEAERILDARREFDSPGRGELYRSMAEHYQSSDLGRALDCAEKALPILRAHGSLDDVWEGLYMLGVIHSQRREPQLAVPALAESVQVAKKAHGDPNASLPRLWAVLGDQQVQLLRMQEAEASLRAALAAARTFDGDDHVDTLETELHLGIFLAGTTRFSEGLQHVEKALEILRRTLGLDDPFYAPQVLVEYGWALAEAGRLENGLTQISQAIENRRKNRPGTRFLGQMLGDQASVLLDLGREREARQVEAEALAILDKVKARPMYQDVENRVRLLWADGRAAEAAEAAQSYRAGLAQGGPGVDRLRALTLEAETALALRQSGAAITKASGVLAELQSGPARGWLPRVEARAALAQGRGYLLENRFREALPLLERAVELRSKVLDPTSPDLADAQIALASCRFALGEANGARTLLRQAQVIQKSHPQLSRDYVAPLHDLERRLQSRGS